MTFFKNFSKKNSRRGNSMTCLERKRSNKVEFNSFNWKKNFDRKVGRSRLSRKFGKQSWPLTCSVAWWWISWGTCKRDGGKSSTSITLEDRMFLFSFLIFHGWSARRGSCEAAQTHIPRTYTKHTAGVQCSSLTVLPTVLMIIIPPVV